MITRFSSRRQPLDRGFLADRLVGALGYDRIAGYFSSSLLEVAGEALEAVSGPVRLVCNSAIERRDVEVALGDLEKVRQTIDAVPQKHPFPLRYQQVERVDWESCARVLEQGERRRHLRVTWR